MPRRKSKKTIRIEHLAEDNQAMRQQLSEQLRTDNPLFEDFERLLLDKEFIMHGIQVHFSLEKYMMIGNLVRDIVSEQIPNVPDMTDADKKQLIIAIQQYFDDAATMRKFFDTIQRGKTQHDHGNER